jgi:peroxiredoxin
MPAFELKNAVGEMIKSDDLLANGPVIISFYRGAWCPYCNLELAAYQEVLEDISAAGGQLIAISPELPDTSMTLIEKHSLGFEILSDLNNLVAKKFGLVFRVADDIVALYKTMGIDLEKSQGNSSFELPFPATYVVNKEGTIVEAAVTYDYRVRLEPEDAIKALKACAY